MWLGSSSFLAGCSAVPLGHPKNLSCRAKSCRAMLSLSNHKDRNAHSPAQKAAVTMDNHCAECLHSILPLILCGCHFFGIMMGFALLDSKYVCPSSSEQYPPCPDVDALRLKGPSLLLLFVSALSLTHLCALAPGISR